MNEFDDTLTRLFAEARETPPADDFLAGVTSRMERERRRRPIKRAALMTAAAAVAVVLTPFIVEGSLIAAGRFGAWLPTLGNALAYPIAWLSSLVLVVWSIHRARRAP